MRGVLVIIVIAIAAVVAWQQGWLGAPSTEPPAEQPAGGLFGEDEAPPVANGELPAAIQEALNAAEAEWQTLAAAGDPSADNAAPRLAKAYSEALRASYAVPAREAWRSDLIATRLQPLAAQLFFSARRYDDPTGLIGTHQVKPGEVGDAIGRTYGLSPQFISMLNGRAPTDDRLAANAVIKIVNAKQTGYHIHVDKSEFTADVFVAGVFAKRFDVGLGASGTPTPTGMTTITARENGVDWTRPSDNAVLPVGHPENILGPLWLALDPAGLGGRTGIGLHGFHGEGPATRVLGSNGCIRLQNDDAQMLYYLMVRPNRAPMTVEIVE